MFGEMETEHEEIARRAYQRFESRGQEDGLDLEDWLVAERELVSERDGAAAAAPLEAMPEPSEEAVPAA
jgi:hypothetical protein